MQLQGHAAPILYAAWVEAGLLTEADILNLRKLDSDLEGHPTPVCFTYAVILLACTKISQTLDFWNVNYSFYY